MFKQCLILRKTEKIGVGSPVSFATYKRLFQKPLMLIGMENALQIIEVAPPESRKSSSYHAGSMPVSRRQSTLIANEETCPEMDVSSVGQTLAIVGFQRKFMKQVFKSDELDFYDKCKQEARQIRKLLKERNQIDNITFVTDQDTIIKKENPLQQLTAFKAAREGFEQAKPFGIDEKEVIRVMSFYGEQDLKNTNQTKR